MEITVRGSAEQTYPAERALLTLAVDVEGADKAVVLRDAREVHEPLTAQLAQLQERQLVTSWSSDDVWAHRRRPWGQNGEQLDPVHAVRVGVRAEFVDFERLSGFVDYWSEREAVAIDGIGWDVTAKNRRTYEAEVRRDAVDDAVAKAQGLAAAVRRGKVEPVRFAEPGLLGDGSPQPMLKAAMFDSVGGGGGLVLTPERITVRVEIDAWFISS